MGEWSDIDLTLQLRFQSPNEVVVNYYMRDEGHYVLILVDNHVIIEKITGGEPAPLGESPAEYYGSESWNKINIKVKDGAQTISINDTQVLTVTDPEPLSGGTVMLHVFGETG